MSAPLGSAHLRTAPLAAPHVLTRVKLEDLTTETDLGAFRTPFSDKWHKLGTGRAHPELITLTGVLEDPNPSTALAALEALLADLPAVTILTLGVHDIPVAGATGSTLTTPTLRGHALTLTLIRSDS